MTTLNSLRYLDFDYSESDTGAGSFDALASCTPEQLPALHAELAAVLAWAHEHFAGLRGDVDEAGEWDYALSSQREWSAADHITFDEAAQHITVQALPGALERHTVSLSLSGRPAFCDAFRERFSL